MVKVRQLREPEGEEGESEVKHKIGSKACRQCPDSQKMEVPAS